MDCFLAPHQTKPTFLPWDASCDEVVSTFRTTCNEPEFWKQLSTHYSAENNSDVILQDNLCCVKSICDYQHVPSDMILSSSGQCSPTP